MPVINVPLSIHASILYTLRDIENGAPKRIKKYKRETLQTKEEYVICKDPSLVTMSMIIHPAVALQSGRERHISQR